MTDQPIPLKKSRRLPSISKNCYVCGASYRIRNSHARNSFCCSSRCMYIRRSEIYRGEKNKSWRGGRFIAKNGYAMIYIPDHPRSYANGYALEHVIVAEKKIGRSLRPTECVHHLNHEKTDNRPANLTVLTISKHKSLHMIERHQDRKVVIISRRRNGQIAKGGSIWASR